MAIESNRRQYPERSIEELRLMRTAGLVNWQAHRIASELVRPGIRPLEIDHAIAKCLHEAEAEPLFLGVPGPGETAYPAVSCISVNDVALHGVPGVRPLEEGDVVSIDLGCRRNGWCADSAETHLVGRCTESAIALVSATSELLDQLIAWLPKSDRWCEVVAQVEQWSVGRPWSIVAGVYGHGIGREMHESPPVALRRDEPGQEFIDFPLVPGLVITLEPVLTRGGGALRIGEDGWTLSTLDGAATAHFEHTVAITEAGPWILTGGPTKFDRHFGLTVENGLR